MNKYMVLFIYYFTLLEYWIVGLVWYKIKQYEIFATLIFKKITNCHNR